MPQKRALLVGINEYRNVSPLNGCAADATELGSLLSKNGDGSPNFDCRILTSPGYHQDITRSLLREQWDDLFSGFKGDALFYFSGHGAPTSTGGYIVTQDGKPSDPGLPMNDILTLANGSSARSVTIILDCCFSGAAGNLSNLQTQSGLDQAILREGVTILAASRPDQVAMERGGHGVFTQLLVGALSGGAMDVRGSVSAAGMYAYAEAALGAWDQRPLYKSHASQLEPVRTCTPLVSDSVLRELPSLFAAPEYVLKMDPSFEHTHSDAKAENVETFDKLKLLRNAGVIRTTQRDDLYYCALNSNTVQLTQLGEFYRALAEKGRI